MESSPESIVPVEPPVASSGPQMAKKAVRKKKIKKKSSAVVPAKSVDTSAPAPAAASPAPAPPGPVVEKKAVKKKVKTKKKVFKKTGQDKKTAPPKMEAPLEQASGDENVPIVQAEEQVVEEKAEKDVVGKAVEEKAVAENVVVVASTVVEAANREEKKKPGLEKEELRFDGIDAVLPHLAPKSTPGQHMTSVFRKNQDEDAVAEAAERERLHKEALQKFEPLAAATIDPAPESAKLLEVKIRKSSEVKKIKDVHVLFNVVVSVGSAKRSSHFFHEAEESDDRVRIPLIDGDKCSVEVTLMGDGKPVGMQMFASVNELLEKTLSLRSGRHCFDVGSSLVPSSGPDAATVLTNRYVLHPISDAREKIIGEVRAVIEEGEKAAPSDLQVAGSSAVFLEHNVRRWASLGCDLEKFCDLIVSSKYHPAQSLAWKTPNGSHLLHLACLAGHEACIAMLLDWPQLYPISAKTSSGATALHFAVLSGNRAAVSLVLSRVEEVELEALLRSVWIRKLTAFHLAAMLGEVGVVAELLTRAKKSSLEVLDHTGSSPLHWAAYTGNAEIIRLLGDSGLCSFSTEDEEGNTPLALAVKHGCLTASEACAGHARAARSLAPSISATSLDTPLWIAMAKGPQFAKVVAEAMQKAEKMAATTNDDWTNTELYKPDFKFGEHENTLLHRAVMVFPDNACSDLIEQLKDNVQIVLNTHKQHPLQLALALGKLKTCSALLLLKGQTDAADAYDNTLLHYAMTGASVDWLNKHKPEVFKSISARNWLSLTPLMHAFALGSKDAISALIAHGADANDVLHNGQSCVALLEERSKSALCLPFSSADDSTTGSFRIPLPIVTSRKSVAEVSRRGSTIRKADKNVSAQIAKAKW